MHHAAEARALLEQIEGIWATGDDPAVLEGKLRLAAHHIEIALAELRRATVRVA